MDRYHRQTLLPTIGPAGQRKLADSSVLLVGVGASARCWRITWSAPASAA
ncbi:MAG: hypothetical protein QM754_10315 [Tepidisphaeraceae bacterium]